MFSPWLCVLSRCNMASSHLPKTCVGVNMIERLLCQLCNELATCPAPSSPSVIWDGLQPSCNLPVDWIQLNEKEWMGDKLLCINWFQDRLNEYCILSMWFLECVASRDQLWKSISKKVFTVEPQNFTRNHQVHRSYDFFKENP